MNPRLDSRHVADGDRSSLDTNDPLPTGWNASGAAAGFEDVEMHEVLRGFSVVTATRP